MFQGQIENYTSKPREIGCFSHFSPIFYPCPSHKLGTPTQLKTTFSNKYITRLPSQKFRIDKLKITVSISNCKQTVFSYVSCKKSLKAPTNCMVTMVAKQKIFDQLYLF